MSDQVEVIQVKADEDGCIYIFNVLTKTWTQKICDIKNAKEIPDSVKIKVQAMQRAAI